MEALRGEGRIKGWRGELLSVVQCFHDQPLFLIERAAATHFGIKTYGERQHFGCHNFCYSLRPCLRVCFLACPAGSTVRSQLSAGVCTSPNQVGSWGLAWRKRYTLTTHEPMTELHPTHPP